MFNVHRRLVQDALDNPLPPKRKIPLRRHTGLASAIPLIDVLLLADRDVPYSQKHSAPSIHHQIQCELAGLRVAGSTVRGYVRKRKIELGLGSSEWIWPLSEPWYLSGCEQCNKELFPVLR